ncbi:MAG: hypothetical protein NVV57_05485 [Demequina sp.]|jgi:hypothetical protein|nr:hypothetical protein [Demequina sp.]
MIFPAIWAILPGPRWVKALTLTIALAAIVFVLFQWVFPWVSVTFNIQDQSVGDQ